MPEEIVRSLIAWQPTQLDHLVDLGLAPGRPSMTSPH
jgi:hypothetical protein